MNILHRLFTWLSSRFYSKELPELEYEDVEEGYPDYDNEDYYDDYDDYPDAWYDDPEYYGAWYEDYYDDEEDYMDGEE